MEDKDAGWAGVRVIFKLKGSGWGTHVYLQQIHFDVWQNQYSILMLNKIKFFKKGKKNKLCIVRHTLEINIVCNTGC